LLLTKVLPLSQSHAIDLLIFSLAPIAPFLPLLVRRAHGDMDFSAALMPFAMLSTVVLLPLLAPLLIKGLTVKAWSLAEPLILLVLLPLAGCAAVRVYSSALADKLFPAVKRLAGISTLLILGFTVAFYFREFISTLGSFAIGAEVIFAVGIALASYRFGFGLKQEQRSAMALAMCTRNASGMFAVFTAFPEQDPSILVMILLAGPLPAAIALPFARYFASRASEDRTGMHVTRGAATPLKGGGR
jgi:BASS family bile acid:Na+ symporter